MNGRLCGRLTLPRDANTMRSDRMQEADVYLGSAGMPSLKNAYIRRYVYLCIYAVRNAREGDFRSATRK